MKDINQGDRVKPLRGKGVGGYKMRTGSPRDTFDIGGMPREDLETLVALLETCEIYCSYKGNRKDAESSGRFAKFFQGILNEEYQ